MAEVADAEVLPRRTGSRAARAAAAAPSRHPARLGLRVPIPRALYVTVAGASFVAVVGVWAALSYGGWVSPLFLPTPGLVAERCRALLADGVLAGDLWISNVRILAGFLAATAVAIPLGMLAGNLRVFEAALEPVLGFARYLPVPAFIPLLMLYTGIGEAPKILVIFVGTVVQEIVMIADVTKATPAGWIRAALAMGARPAEVFTKVIWPASLPGIVDVARINLGFAWTYLVVAELVAANEGLGYRILKSQRFLQTDTIFLYLLVIGALGIACDMLFKLFQRRVFAWSEQKVHG